MSKMIDLGYGKGVAEHAVEEAVIDEASRIRSRVWLNENTEQGDS